MKSENLPPLSPEDAVSKRSTVCSAVRLYLAVWDDLTSEQMRLVSYHVHVCEPCARQQELFLGVTRSIRSLPDTEPSPRIDRAVLDAIAACSRANTRTDGSMQQDEQFVPSFKNQSRTWLRSLLDLQHPSTRVAVLIALFIFVIFIAACFCH